MKIWHREDSDALGDIRVLRLLNTLPPVLGAAALGFLGLLKGWCSRRQDSTIPTDVVADVARRLRLTPRRAEQIAAALVAARLMVATPDGLMLADRAIIERPQAATPATGKKARQQRYKQKLRQRVTSPDSSGDAQGDGGEASPQASPRETGGVSPGVSQGDGEASPQASPGDAPPSQTLPPRTSTSTSTGPETPPPPAAAGGVVPEEPGSEFAAEEPPTARQALQAKYFAAYGAGISAVTGDAWAAPTTKAEGQSLGQMLKTYAKGPDGAPLRGVALLSWLTDTTRAYAEATHAEARFERGFAPSKCLEWLKSGRPRSAPRSAGRGLPPAEPQPVSPGPARPRWKPAVNANDFILDDQGRLVNKHTGEPLGKAKAAE